MPKKKKKPHSNNAQPAVSTCPLPRTQVVFLVQASPRFHFGRGVEAYGAGHYEEAVRLFRLAAAQGHAIAQCHVGVCFARGQGVAQDREQAVAFFRLAAAQGHAAAQFNLGGCFERGKGVEQDREQAVAFFRLAAAKGHADAQFNLALCLLARGAENDQDEALRLLHEASDSGLEVATAELAGLAAAKKDLALAGKLRKRARKQAKVRAEPDHLAYLDRMNVGDATRCHNEGCDKQEASLSAKRRGVGAVESVCVAWSVASHRDRFLVRR
jgi:TPR repeat protein